MTENPVLPSTFEVADVSPKFVPPSKPISRVELGKLRKAHLTKVLPEVVACGHKLDSQRMPSNNCQDCWYAYWRTSASLGEIHKELAEGGKEHMVNKYGAKFTKMFGRFLANELKEKPVGV